MRAAREHPRLVVAKALGMLCLIGCSLAAGFLLGAGRDGGHERVVRTAQLRVVATERALRGEAAVLRETRAQLERHRSARDRLRARLRASARSNVRLRRALRTTRRELARARR